MKYFLAIDCGLTKIKADIFSEDGRKVCERQADTPLSDCLIDTRALRAAVTFLVRSVLSDSGVGAEEVVCAATSGHGNGLYPMGKDGPLQFGYSSMFSASAPYTPPTGKVFDITGQTSWSGQPLPILAYLKNERPDVFEKTEKILFCKDVIKYFLTGDVLTEYTDASAAGLLDRRTSAYSEELLSVYGLSGCLHLLPRITLGASAVSHVSAGFAAESGLSEKTAVVGGLFDVNACMLGAGVTRPGKYCVIGGTWGINSAVTEKPVLDKSITQCTNFLSPDKYMCIDSAPTGCANIEWFLRNVARGMSYAEADAAVLSRKTDGELLYLPYIYGAPDVSDRASFIGLGASHDVADMLRAVYEGVVFEHARRIEKLKKSVAVFDSAVLTGGAANGTVLPQMLADVTGLKITTVMQSQTGSLGCAALCAAAVGLFPSVEAAVDSYVEQKAVFEPKDAEAYRAKYELFKNSLHGRDQL